MKHYKEIYALSLTGHDILLMALNNLDDEGLTDKEITEREVLKSEIWAGKECILIAKDADARAEIIAKKAEEKKRKARTVELDDS